MHVARCDMHACLADVLCIEAMHAARGECCDVGRGDGDAYMSET